AKLTEARLVRVYVERRSDQRSSRRVQRPELARAAMKQAAHRAARDGNTDALVFFLEPVLRHRARALGHDQMGYEARCVSSLLAHTHGWWCGDDVSTNTRACFALDDATPEVARDVFVDRGRFAPCAPQLVAATPRTLASFGWHWDVDDLGLELGAAQFFRCSSLLRSLFRIGLGRDRRRHLLAALASFATVGLRPPPLEFLELRRYRGELGRELVELLLLGLRVSFPAA